MKKIIVLICLIYMLVSCATTSSSTGGPAWVENKYIKYPEAEYMVEIGQGSSLKDAKSNGSAVLAQIFKTSIKVETTIQTRYRELSSGGSVRASEETDFDQDITQLADQDLINVNFGESWTNEYGQVYVLAYIDRQETAAIYRERINRNNRTVSTFIGKSAGQDSLIRKYAYLDAAYVVAQGNRVLFEQLEIINLPVSRTVKAPYSFDHLRNSRKDTALAMTFRINIENDSEGKITSVIADELSFIGFTIDPLGIIDVSGSIAFEEIELDNDYENMKYYLTIDIRDENGISVAAIENNERISAISVTDVKNRSYNEIEKTVKKDLVGRLTSFFDSFVE